jgi:hypothetical protein
VDGGGLFEIDFRAVKMESISVNFFVYTSEINRTSRFKPNTGFVYIFRMTNEIGRPVDETRPLEQLSPVDLSKADHQGLGSSHLHFFFYSRIQLSNDRINDITEDLKDFIAARNRDRNAKRNCRAKFIPFTRQQSGIYTYRTNSELQDYHIHLYSTAEGAELSMEDHDREVNSAADIYLFDWYKYLEDIQKDCQEIKQNRQYDFFDQDIDLSEYNNFPEELREAFPVFSNAQPDRIRISERFENGRDVFSFGGLFAVTKMLDELIKSTPGRHHDDNLRQYTYTPYASGHIPASSGPYPVYKIFLRQYESLIDAYKAASAPVFARFMRILQNGYANSTFIDYMYAGGNDKQEFLKILGNIFENDYIVISEQMQKELVDLLAGAFEDGIDSIPNLSFNNSREVHGRMGEVSFLVHLFTYDNINFLADEVQEIYGALLVPLRQIPGIAARVCNILTAGLFRDYVVLDKGQLIVSKGQLSLYIKETGLSNRYGRLLTFQEAAAQWQTDGRPKLERMGVGNIDFKDSGGSLKITAKGFDARGALTGIGVLVAAYGTLYQVALSKELLEGGQRLYSIPEIVGAGGNITGIIGDILSLKKVGGAAMAAAALESGIRAFIRFSENDGDAGAAYTASTMFYGLAAALIFTGGSGLAMAGLAAAGFAFTALAKYLTDDDVDRFIKYSIWGTHYREPGWADRRKQNHPLPSWWPDENYEVAHIVSSDWVIRAGWKQVKRNALDLSNEKHDNAQILDFHTAMFNAARQMPDASYRVAKSRFLGAMRTINGQTLIALWLNNFTVIKEITLNIYAFGENNKMGPSQYTYTVDLDQENSCACLYQWPDDKQPLVFQPVERLENLADVNTFCVLLIPNERAVLEQINEYERVNLGIYARHNPNAPLTRSLEEFASQRSIPRVVLEYGNNLQRGQKYSAAVQLKYRLSYLNPIEFHKEITVR